MRLNDSLLVQHLDATPDIEGCTVFVDEDSGEEVCIPDVFLDAVLQFLKHVADNR